MQSTIINSYLLLLARNFMENCRTAGLQDWTITMHFKQEDWEISASRAVQLSNQSREEKLIKVSLPSLPLSLSLTPSLPPVSPPLCQVRLSANPKRLLQREVQSLNIILVVVSVCLEQPSPANTILLDKLHNTITTTLPLHYLSLTTLTSHTLIDNSHAVHSQHLNWFQ